ncbi:hypothetical protein HYH02_013161 [Chlamydomonas schloesseri]|uniref:Uncharacterized protein n=1 Tax=Chlamydomonas schloesseri TaxID=2026947 RepID=A0A835SXS7_9CHLO|nr:hypothetical protein HYH02_013161 [Chlamydomonas schloesseri]|eukprot:KAG2431943.1 hypothetical protein HYH02_013161 [Chlamydomonas schloesseri]
MARLQFAGGGAVVSSSSSGGSRHDSKPSGAEPAEGTARVITVAMLEAAEAAATAEEAAAAAAAVTPATSVRSILVKEQPRFGSVLQSPSYRRMSETGIGRRPFDSGGLGGGGGHGLAASASSGRSPSRETGNGGGGVHVSPGMSMSRSGSSSSIVGMAAAVPGSGVPAAARPQLQLQLQLQAADARPVQDPSFLAAGGSSSDYERRMMTPTESAAGGGASGVETVGLLPPLSGAGRSSPSRRFSSTGGGVGGGSSAVGLTRRAGGLVAPGGGASAAAAASVAASGGLYDISEHRPTMAEWALLPAGSIGRGRGAAFAAATAASAGADDWASRSLLRTPADQASPRLSRHHSGQGEGLQTTSMDGLRGPLPRRSARMSDNTGLGGGFGPTSNTVTSTGSAKLLQTHAPSAGGGGPAVIGSSYRQLRRAASTDLSGVAVPQAVPLNAGAGPAVTPPPLAAAVADGVVREAEEGQDKAATRAAPFRVQPPAAALPAGAARPWRGSGVGGRAG